MADITTIDHVVQAVRKKTMKSGGRGKSQPRREEQRSAGKIKKTMESGGRRKSNRGGRNKDRRGEEKIMKWEGWSADRRGKERKK